MNSIRRIANSEYYAISVGQQDDWIMHPAMGRWPVWNAGMLSDGTAWFFNGDSGFAFYDAAQRQLAGRLQTPWARDQNDTETRDNYLRYGLVLSEDGHLAYLLLLHAVKPSDLHVIDLQQRKIISSFLGLPESYVLGKPVLTSDGKLLYSAILRDDGIVTALVRIDPQTGHHDISTCEGSRADSYLIKPSPDGRYWLRADNSRLPMMAGKTSAFSRLLGQSTQEYFGGAVEIWEAFPLRLLHSLVPAWLSAEELPDQGFLDYEASKQGLPARRGEIYRKISQALDRDPALTARRLTKDSHPDLCPDPAHFYNNVTSNFDSLALSERTVIGWQPDSQAVWLMPFVCVGMDGTVSPRIMLERFRTHPRSWYDQESRPLPDRRLELRFEEGFVTVSGAPAGSAQQTQIVPLSEEHFRPAPPPYVKDEREAALVKKAEAIARKNSTYSIDLASMSDADCVAAIDTLASRIGPDISDRVFDNRIQAVFKLDGKRINEKKFFKHVAANCPSAGPALRKLIEATCDHVGPHTRAWYDPYADDELPTGLFGYAAWCLARLDRSSNDVLVRYYELIDTYHESFYFEETVPLMLDNTANATERLQLAEGFYFSELGNAGEHATFWRWAKMAESAGSSMTPKEYAARLLALAAKTEAERSETDLGYYCFDNLARGLTHPTDWEKTLLQEIRGAVSHP